MIQPPERIGRPLRTRVAAAIVGGIVLAVPAIGVVAGLASAPPRVASTPPVPTPRTAAVAPSRPAPSAAESVPGRLVVSTDPGPMALGVGGGHAWLATGGDGSVRRIDPDGRVDRIVALGRPTLSGGPRPTIGLAAGAAWIAGLTGRLELVALDATSTAVVARVDLPAPASGIVGGFGAAWIATADGRLLRVEPSGDVREVLPPSRAGLHLAIGDRFVWASLGDRVLAVRPDGSVARRFAVGGGPIAVRDETVWVLGTSGPARDLAAIDEATLRTSYRSDVGTSGFADVAWALPSIVPLTYADAATAVAPRTNDAALVDGVAWVTRAGEGELWRIPGRETSSAP